MTNIGPCLAQALSTLGALGETTDWQDFAMVGRYNAMSSLKKRKWIIDLNAERRRVYAGKKRPMDVFPPRWTLTRRGRLALERLQAND